MVMATTVLALLLGVTITVVAGLTWFVRKEKTGRCDLDYGCQLKFAAIEERFVALERRKAVIAEAVASQPKPAGVGGVRPRSWSEMKNELEAQD